MRNAPITDTDSMNHNLNFSVALVLLKRGEKLARKGWKDLGMFIKMQVPNEHSKMSKPYIYLHVSVYRSQDTLVPWIPSQEDMFAEDWSLIIDL